MQFRVVIPPNVRAGQTIRIRCPDGTEGDVKVPKGLKPGDSFIFEMPLLESMMNSDNKAVINSATTADVEKKSGFLDREIATIEDFVMALGVGLLIGGSIVLGFLLGVLAVTDPDYELETSNSAAASPPPPPNIMGG